MFHPRGGTAAEWSLQDAEGFEVVDVRALDEAEPLFACFDGAGNPSTRSLIDSALRAADEGGADRCIDDGGIAAAAASPEWRGDAVALGLEPAQYYPPELQKWLARNPDGTCQRVADVEAMYNYAPYPPRDVADERPNVLRAVVVSPIILGYHVYAGRRQWRGAEVRMLFAGAGTGDAVLSMGLMLDRLGVRRAHLVHFDLSHEASAVARGRLAVHKRRGTLASVTVDFVVGSLANASLVRSLPQRMGGPFDLINCVGVLHHLPDPLAALRSLRDVLAPDGGLELMVYGRQGRSGLYEFQSVERKLTSLVGGHGADDSAAQADGVPGSEGGDVQSVDEGRDPIAASGLSLDAPASALLDRGMGRDARVRRIETMLNALPDFHQVKTNKRIINSADAGPRGASGLSDLFLHSCDRAFAFPELLQLAGAAGMHLRASLNRHDYDLVPFVRRLATGERARPWMAEALTSRLAASPQAMPWHEEATLGELVRGSVHKHYVILVRDDNPVQDEVVRMRAAAATTAAASTGEGGAVDEEAGVEADATGAARPAVSYPPRVTERSVVCLDSGFQRNSNDAIMLNTARELMIQGLEDPKLRFDITDGLQGFFWTPVGYHLPALTGLILASSDCVRSVADMHALIFEGKGVPGPGQSLLRWEELRPKYSLTMPEFVDTVADLVLRMAVSDVVSVLDASAGLDHRQRRDLMHVHANDRGVWNETRRVYRPKW